MSKQDCNKLFFKNTFFKCNIDYAMAYFFFIISNSFLWILLLANPFNINFVYNKTFIIFISCITWFFITTILSRLFCVKTETTTITDNKLLLQNKHDKTTVILV